MEKLSYMGSTSSFYRVRPGILAKNPSEIWKLHPTRWQECLEAISIEHQIFKHLGPHRTIVKYLGESEAGGIYLAEASNGSLQAFLDATHDLDLHTRWALVLQASDSLVFLHNKGVIHSDLRPENMLVHSAEVGSSKDLSLWLCDFGGSLCEELGLNGCHLPDDPFFDPRLPPKATPAMDIFSLGSIIYTIITGHWPFCGSPPPINKERYTYQDDVHKLFKDGIYPDVTNVSGGKVIMGCWEHTYHTAQEVLNAVKMEISLLGVQ